MILSMKGRIMSGLGVFLGLICVFYLLVYLPQFAHKETLNSEISQQKVVLARLKAKIQELEELKKENQKMLQDLSFFEKKLKRTQASFLYELGTRGEVYGIEYVNITPSLSVEEKYYFRTPVNVHLYGKYHNLGILFSDIVKRGELGSFTVDSVLLRTSSKEGYSVEANLTLSLYKYKSISYFSKENSSFSTEEVPPEKSERRER